MRCGEIGLLKKIRNAIWRLGVKLGSPIQRAVKTCSSSTSPAGWPTLGMLLESSIACVFQVGNLVWYLIFFFFIRPLLGSGIMARPRSVMI